MIQPLHDKVLIERIEAEQAGIIIVPDVAKQASMLGRVLAVGPGKRIEGTDQRKPMESRPGDIVYFNSKWDDLSGTHYSDDKLRDKHIHLVMEADILLKVKNGA